MKYLVAMLVAGSVTLSADSPDRDAKLNLLALKVYAIGGAVMDAHTSLANNPYANIEEMNPLLRRADGSVSPARLVALKSAQIGVMLYALHAKPKSRVVRWVVFGVSSFDWYAAYHNAHLPRTRTREYHY